MVARWGRGLLVAALVGVGLAVVAAPVVAAPGDVQVGQLTLRPCDIVKRALCGSILRPWEPGNPDAGNVRVGFAFVPARQQPAVDTLVPHEGGPGYSTTGTGRDYAAMYGPLLERRNLLLVDQRGTGLSRPLRCPDLQNLVIEYHVAAGRCGRSLGDRADDYGSVRSADDLASVIAKLGLTSVSLYGDSYGTFFAQTFAGRYPELVRSIVLDSAYPTYGESAWYPTQSPAMRAAFTKVCQRSAECRSAGRGFLPTMRAVLAQVRKKPWQGTAYDAEGTRTEVRVDGAALTSVAFGATYAPAFYRELTAALRSALRGDRAPLLRLVAEAVGGSSDAGPARDYSEGLDATVACHDYPQLYDMTASPGAVRERQLERAIAARGRTHPQTYGPFTVREYADSDWQMLDWCTRWPVAAAGNPAGPIRPAVGYPDVPVLVLSGELDSITTAAEGDLVAGQFPNARHIVVRNSFHVTALSDRDGCGESILRAFVRSPGSESAVAGCAEDVEPVRALGIVPRTLGDVSGVGIRRAGPAAALTVEDVVDRWWNNYSGAGVGPARRHLQLHRQRRGEAASPALPPAPGSGRLRPGHLGPRPPPDARRPDAWRCPERAPGGQLGHPGRRREGGARGRRRGPPGPPHLPRALIHSDSPARMAGDQVSATSHTCRTIGVGLRIRLGTPRRTRLWSVVVEQAQQPRLHQDLRARARVELAPQIRQVGPSGVHRDEVGAGDLREGLARAELTQQGVLPLGDSDDPHRLRVDVGDAAPVEDLEQRTQRRDVGRQVVQDHPRDARQRAWHAVFHDLEDRPVRDPDSGRSVAVGVVGRGLEEHRLGAGSRARRRVSGHRRDDAEGLAGTVGEQQGPGPEHLGEAAEVGDPVERCHRLDRLAGREMDLRTHQRHQKRCEPGLRLLRRSPQESVVDVLTSLRGVAASEGEADVSPEKRRPVTVSLTGVKRRLHPVLDVLGEVIDGVDRSSARLECLPEPVHPELGPGPLTFSLLQPARTGRLAPGERVE